MTEGDRSTEPRRIQGVVESDRMDKTIVVKRDRLERHPLYGKFVRRTTTYYAHDEQNEAREGDRVEIVATRPLSKLKRWRLGRVLVRRIVDVEAPAEETSQGAEP
jgi:small subunit ribosomal protein S17